MNNTIFYNLSKEYSPTHDCFNWCKQQHLTHASNEFHSGLILVFIPFALLSIVTLIIKYPDIISQKLNMKESDLIYMSELFINYSFFILLGYFIYVLWIL